MFAGRDAAVLWSLLFCSPSALSLPQSEVNPRGVGHELHRCGRAAVEPHNKQATKKVRRARKAVKARSHVRIAHVSGDEAGENHARIT